MKADFPEDSAALVARYAQNPSEEEGVDVNYRFLHFLYTGEYQRGSICNIGIKQFEDIDDELYNKHRKDFLHASMYALATKYCMPELAKLASCAFREDFDKETFSKNPSWPELVSFIYESTPNTARDLRIVVIREIQVASHHEQVDLGMGKLEEAINEVPELGVDLATTKLTKKKYACADCGTRQWVLCLKCMHDAKHKYGDAECFTSGLASQECYVCHGLEVFTGEARDDSLESTTLRRNLRKIREKKGLAPGDFAPQFTGGFGREFGRGRGAPPTHGDGSETASRW